MAGGRLGTIFVELNIDDKVFKQKLSEELKSTQTTAIGMERIWKHLGITTEATYRQEVMAYQNSMTLIRASTELTARDRIRAEQVITLKLKALHEEQVADVAKTHAANNRMSRDSQSGWISMMKGMLAYRAIMYGMQIAWEATVGSMTKGIQKIDEFLTTQASMAAAISSVDISVTFDQAYATAGNLITQMELLDRKFIGTADELRILANAMLTYGMGVDLATEKTQNQFVAFANALKMITGDQSFQKQAMQEVRALMEGANVQGAMLVKRIEAAGYSAKKMVPIWREQGVLLEKVMEILSGYAQAGGAIENTLMAQKGTLTTIYTKVLREGMSEAYDDIRDLVRGINDELLGMNGLTEKGKDLVETLKGTWRGLKDIGLEVAAVWTMVATAFRVAGTAIGGVAGMLANVLNPKAAMEIYDSIWPALTKHIDDATAALKRYSDESSGTAGAARSEARALADFYGYEAAGGLEAKGGGRKSGESDADKKRIKDAEDLAKLRFNIAMAEAQELDAALILGNQLMDKYELDQIREQLKAKEKLNKEFADQAYKDAVADDQARIEGNAAMNLMELEAIREKIKQQKEAEKEAYETLKAFAVNAFNDMADTLANFVTTGKINFRDFIDSALADLTRLIVRMQMFNLLKSTGAIEFLTPAAVTKLPGMASGGPVTGGSPYMVGERGPEMFIPASSGSIVPNSGGGGSVTVNIRNDGGQQVAAKSAKASFDLQGAVIDIVIDGVQRNVHGLRYALGGA